MIVFEPEDIYQLLVHYDDGQHLPLEAKVLGFAINQNLEQYIGLAVESDSWPSAGVDVGPTVPKMVHIRYEGNRVMSWDQKGADPTWAEAPNAPTRQ